MKRKKCKQYLVVLDKALDVIEYRSVGFAHRRTHPEMLRLPPIPLRLNVCVDFSRSVLKLLLLSLSCLKFLKIKLKNDVVLHDIKNVTTCVDVNMKMVRKPNRYGG